MDMNNLHKRLLIEQSNFLHRFQQLATNVALFQVR
jgi:hypothetical protein